MSGALGAMVSRNAGVGATFLPVDGGTTRPLFPAARLEGRGGFGPRVEDEGPRDFLRAGKAHPPAFAVMVNQAKDDAVRTARGTLTFATHHPRV